MNNDLIALIELIERRPALYLSRNTISALRAFIDGWMVRSPDNIINAEILTRVQRHVETVFEIDGHAWDKIILLFSEDEHDALQRFFNIFNTLK